jgi:hypothetical protein
LCPSRGAARTPPYTWPGLAWPGLADYEITGSGKNIWSVRDDEWVDDGYSESSFPFVKLLANDQLVDLNRNAVAALAWLTPEQRAEVRERFPGGLDQPWPEEALELEQKWHVSIYRPEQLRSQRVRLASAAQAPAQNWLEEGSSLYCPQSGAGFWSARTPP